MAKNNSNSWQIATFILIGVLVFGLITGFIVLGKDNGGNTQMCEPQTIKGYKNQIINWNLPTLESWQTKSYVQGVYIIIGDNPIGEEGTEISVQTKEPKCSSWLREMEDNGQVTFIKTIKGTKIYGGTFFEMFCSGDDKFVVKTIPKSSPIQDKYFEEFAC